MTSELYEKLTIEGTELEDDGYCSVIALAVLFGCDFESAQAVMAAAGREIGDGAYDSQIAGALYMAGWKVEAQWTLNAWERIKWNTKRIGRAIGWDEGYFLIFPRDHVAAMVDGQVHDYTADEFHRVYHVWQVNPSVDDWELSNFIELVDDEDEE